MTTLFRQALDMALALALPPVCLCCERALPSPRPLVCSRCWSRVPGLPGPQCVRCGHPQGDGGASCRWCPQLPDSVARARSWCWVPEGGGGEIVHLFKYGGWPRLAHEMASRMASLGTGLPAHARATLVPVPLGARRRRERGYNQAEELARALATRWRMPMAAGTLVRARETQSQVLLTPDARSANVQGAFAAGPAADVLRGSHVVLVDDVITTAATLSAAAGALGHAGALSISFVTFGRARAAWDRRATSRSSTP